MPLWLQNLVGVCAIISLAVALYSVIDKKRWNRQQKYDELNDKIVDLEADMAQVKKITDCVEEYMQDQLIETLSGARARRK